MEKLELTLSRIQLPDGTCPMDLPFDPAEYEAMRAQWANEVETPKDGWDCPKCHGKGYTVLVNEHGHMESNRCSCMDARQSLARMKRSGLGETLEAYTFDSFQTPEKWQRDMKHRAMDYVADNEGKWFAAVGAVGAGKSHICTAICGELLKAGLDVRYMRWRDDGSRLKAAVNDSKEYLRMIEPLKSARVLYIDDLFKTQRDKPVTQGDVNLAFELLDARYIDRKKITVISSEKTLSEMLDIDEAVGSRIYERCKQSCVNLTGSKNWRLRKAVTL